MHSNNPARQGGEVELASMLALGLLAFGAYLVQALVERNVRDGLPLPVQFLFIGVGLLGLAVGLALVIVAGAPILPARVARPLASPMLAFAGTSLLFMGGAVALAL